MAIQQKPIPGNYYINLTGQLIRVMMLVYSEGKPSRVMIEYLDGRRMGIDISEWSWLDLSEYPDWLSRRSQSSDLEYEI